MALRWADSFDHYGTTTYMLRGAYLNISSEFSISNVRARTGNRSLLFTPSFGNSIARRSVGIAAVTIGFGFGLYVSSMPDDGRFGYSFRDGSSNEVVSVYYNNTGQLVVKRGATVLAISDAIIVPGSFQHIETKVVRDNVVGSVEVRVDSTTVINATGLNLGTSNIGAVEVGKYVNGSMSIATYYDDWICWDDTGSVNNNFMGPQRVYTTFCDADTAVEDWTTTGTTDAFDAVNDPGPPDDDATYIQSTTATQKIELELPTLPAEVAVVSGVFVHTHAKLTAAGTGNVQASVVNGANSTQGPDQTVTTSYVYWPSVFQVNPTTLAPFTKAEFEASKIRLEKTV